MSMPRHNPKVDLNQKEIVHALEKIGCTVKTIGRPVDLLVGYRAKNFLIEVKRPGQKPRTDTQIEFLKTWKGQVRVVTTIDEALELVTRAYQES